MDPISGIDHIVAAVTNLDRAEQTYRRLGFMLSPRGVHSSSMGTANHTIMFDRDYLELLTVLTRTDRNRPWRSALARGEGVAGLALSTPKAAAARRAWFRAGLSPGEVVGFSRIVKRRDGTIADARFEIVSLPEGTVPETEVFACGHLVREAVWLPELVEHRNTAFAIRKLTVAALDPAETAEFWKPVLPNCRVFALEGGVCLSLGRYLIDVINPRTAARQIGLVERVDRPRTVGLHLAVRDIDACRAALMVGGVHLQIDGDRTWILPEEAHGVAITFVPG